MGHGSLSERKPPLPKSGVRVTSVSSARKAINVKPTSRDGGPVLSLNKRLATPQKTRAVLKGTPAKTGVKQNVLDEKDLGVTKIPADIPEEDEEKECLKDGVKIEDKNDENQAPAEVIEKVARKTVVKGRTLTSKSGVNTQTRGGIVRSTRAK